MTAFVRRAAIALGLTLAAGSALAQTPVKISLTEAEQKAVQGHPQIRARQYVALAAGETVRSIKSVYFPTLVGSISGAQAQTGSRIAAGGLNNPIILDRFAYGASGSQLVTDFGRTSALADSASLRVSAEQQNVATIRADVLLEVNRGYLAALRAGAILKVAEQTVQARQLVVDQVSALASAGLKSALDLSFAKVNLSEAQLLLSQAGNDVRASHARLAALLGDPPATTYELTSDPMTAPPPNDSAPLIAQALRDRPDVASERISEQSSEKFERAERALWFPTITIAAAAGLAPYHNVSLADRYSAIGFNVTLPLNNGNYFAARRAEAAYRVSAGQQRVREVETRVARDVQLAWLEAQTAYQRVDLTNQFLAQAADAMDLAQQRYNLGLSSIVELTQAQLNHTRAEIEQASARYEYESRNAVLRHALGALR